ncbi:MAG TPA: hypothetical protein VHV55_02600 [Pirellulales bacterium]|jgi:hypothetical protein|nr:hypothetical protein [Pirellulales bacterium]
MKHLEKPILIAVGAVLLLASLNRSEAAELLGGVARIDITDREAGPVHDPSFAKALVLKNEHTTVVLITVDAVAIGEIGRIRNDFLTGVRAQLKQELGIPPASVLVNASHCHGRVRGDSQRLVVQAVKEAWKQLTPVTVGAGAGTEQRISENRRLKMKDGSEVDMRRAYSMPPDDAVAGVGPIDPQIGLLRIDRADGKPLAVLYNFACHPIMNPPNKGSSADYPGYASKVIEESLGGGALAFFVQGCGGDINPVRYKEVNQSPDAEPLGNFLGLSVMRAVRQIQTKTDGQLKITSETITLPRGADLELRIAAIQSEQQRLLHALKPTNINFKTFVPLLVQERLSPEFPSAYSQSYLHDKMIGNDDLAKLDSDNRASVDAYLKNIQIMEELTRLNTNRTLLEKHLAQNKAAAQSTLDVEICGWRVGDFKLVTFPGELTVQIGLNIKRAAGDPHAFVAGYTNGYIYYAPTTQQRKNTGYAQEDCDSLVAPEWQRIFELTARQVLKQLGP